MKKIQCRYLIKQLCFSAFPGTAPDAENPTALCSIKTGVAYNANTHCNIFVIQFKLFNFNFLTLGLSYFISRVKEFF
jgi:hypothetical protein